MRAFLLTLSVTFSTASGVNVIHSAELKHLPALRPAELNLTVNLHSDPWQPTGTSRFAQYALSCDPTRPAAPTTSRSPRCDLRVGAVLSVQERFADIKRLHTLQLRRCADHWIIHPQEWTALPDTLSPLPPCPAPRSTE